jgi:hypothetical protein
MIRAHELDSGIYIRGSNLMIYRLVASRFHPRSVLETAKTMYSVSNNNTHIILTHADTPPHRILALSAVCRHASRHMGKTCVTDAKKSWEIDQLW